MKHPILLAACLLAGAAHAQATGGQPARGGMDMKPMMEQQNKDMMAMAMTGNPDLDFARMMRRHHEGGIAMAEEYLRHGKDKELRAMARKMIREQKKESADLAKQERQEQK